jgi:SAM-dependent methyltransferase
MARVLVLAPETLVHVRNGHIIVQARANELPAFQTENPMLIGWICQFFRPIDADAALAALNPANRSAVTEVVDYLLRIGVLVQAGKPPGQSASAEVDARTREHLQVLARTVYDTACDIIGFGPYAERELTARTGIGVERRLAALVAAVEGLREDLHGLRYDFVMGQLRKLDVPADARALNLHIGCGRGHLAGWINIDVHPAPLAMNVLWGLPFSDGSARHVFVSHLLEHLFVPNDVGPFLRELRRVLAPGGVVRIVVPDIAQCIEAYIANDETFFASRRETWSWWAERGTRLEEFLAYAGASPEPAHLFEAHKYGYDFETLQRVLVEAGFTAVIRSGYMESEHEALQVDNVSAVANARYGNRHYSLFVEARSPDSP